jgi:hypothetical protein
MEKSLSTFLLTFFLEVKKSKVDLEVAKLTAYNILWKATQIFTTFIILSECGPIQLILNLLNSS